MYTFNTGAIFLPGHPYIESTRSTVLSDKDRLNSGAFSQVVVRRFGDVFGEF